MKDFAPLARIVMRIIGGILVGRGYASEDSMWIFTDPEVVGIVTLVLSEGWWLAARKFGWPT